MSFRATLTVLTLFFASLTLIGTMPVVRVPEAQANPVDYTLWGHTFFGWGFTQAEITFPGPTLEAVAGETVQMTLFSADAPTGHTFGVDYNGNGFLDGTEEETGFFSSKTTGFMASITANSTHPGTYTYWCGVHLGNMRGTFIIHPAVTHDVAVAGVSASRSFAYEGVSSPSVSVDVTVVNQGTVSETTTVTARAGVNLIGSTAVTVAAGTSTIVSFNWDAYLLARGTYTLSAEASQVTGETDLADNTFPSGPSFTVRLAGDVNGDCAVNFVDLGRVGSSFLRSTGQPGYDLEADINLDGVINFLDLGIVGSNFLKSCG